MPDTKGLHDVNFDNHCNKYDVPQKNLKKIITKNIHSLFKCNIALIYIIHILDYQT